MSLSQLKQLFIVGMLGFALVGCSSTPTAEETQAAEAQAVTAQAEAEAKAATAKAAEVKAAEEAAIAAEASTAKQKQQDLLAALQGKVVNFDFDRSEVKTEFYNVIKMNADYLAMNASASVTVKGYCDERGTREYNLALGERRANAVKNALIAEGVSPSRINTISYGEENPVAMGHNEAAWSQNRRAEFAY